MFAPLDASESERALDVLVAAFMDDPMMCWIYVNPEHRRVGLRTFFQAQITRMPADGAVEHTPGFESVAIWFPPGADLAPVFADFPQALMELIGEQAAIEKLTGMAEISKAHPHTPHWYLATVGTDPAYQGQGHGPKVLRPVLRAADEAGLPCYLESSNVRNVAFYERLEFEALTTITMPNGPVMTPMFRSPQPLA